jgi:hypothetical protein
MTPKTPAGNPRSAEVMPGLSKRAQALLSAPRNNIAIGTKADADKRMAMRKAVI